MIKAKPNGVKTFQNFPRTAPKVRGEYLPALHLIYFIIGADSLFSIDKWYHADYVMKNCHLLAANRDNLDDEMIKQRIEFLKNTYGALIDIIDTPALPYSSTVIRENLKNGVSVEKMINPAVYDYIMKHGLYGVKSSKLEE